MEHWTVEGIGLTASHIMPYIDMDKVVKETARLFPTDEFIQSMRKNNQIMTLDELTHRHEFFGSIGELVALCDPTGHITYTGTEDDEYIYVPLDETGETPAHKDILITALKAVTNAPKIILLVLIQHISEEGYF